MAANAHGEEPVEAGRRVRGRILKAQRRGEAMTKRKIAAIAVLSVVIASVIILLVAPQRRGGFGGGAQIALLRVTGPIEEASGSLLGGAAISPALFAERLQEAEDDPSVRALVVRISSPGGSVAASQEIAAMFDAFSKPIVVSMGDVAASGGYYIAARADSIVAQPGTLTGSIGVIWAGIDPTDLLDDLGIEIDAITAGKHKEMFLPGRLTGERRRIVQDIVDDSYEQFVEAVAEGRGMTRDEVERLATGEPFTGAQALSHGLVDRLGGEADAVEVARQLAGIDDATVKVMTPSFFEALFSGSGAALEGAAEVPTATGLDERVLLLRDVLRGVGQPRYEMR